MTLATRAPLFATACFSCAVFFFLLVVDSLTDCRPFCCGFFFGSSLGDGAAAVGAGAAGGGGDEAVMSGCTADGVLNVVNTGTSFAATIGCSCSSVLSRLSSGSTISVGLDVKIHFCYPFAKCLKCLLIRCNYWLLSYGLLMCWKQAKTLLEPRMRTTNNIRQEVDLAFRGSVGPLDRMRTLTLMELVLCEDSEEVASSRCHSTIWSLAGASNGLDKSGWSDRPVA